MSKELDRWAKLAGLPKTKPAPKKKIIKENIGGVIGVGAINNPLEREKAEYETVFEHYLNDHVESLDEEKDEREGTINNPTDPNAHGNITGVEEGEEEVTEGISDEAIDRMEGTVNMQNLKTLQDMLRITTTDWTQEGFEKGDVQDYISDFINKI